MTNKSPRSTLGRNEPKSYGYGKVGPNTNNLKIGERTNKIHGYKENIVIANYYSH